MRGESARGRCGKEGRHLILAVLVFSLSLALTPVRTHGARPKHFLGPMIHWNYGDGASRLSVSLEGSYWFDPEKTPIPVGFDYALEWQSPGVWRIYSEAQAGILIVGYGAGPVLEFGQGRFTPGLQGTMWMNMFFGMDIRGRLMAVGPHSYGNGVYVKVPLDGESGSLVIE
jgi:hypothetical protein